MAMMPSRTSRLSSTTKIGILFATADPLPRDWLSSLRFEVASGRRQSEGETDRMKRVCGSPTASSNCCEPATCGGDLDLPRHLGHASPSRPLRSEEHTSELQSPDHLVCRLLLEKKNTTQSSYRSYHRSSLLLRKYPVFIEKYGSHHLHPDPFFLHAAHLLLRITAQAH